MIASHRAPVVSLLSAGGVLFVAALMLPHIFSPDTPQGILVAARWMFWTALPLLIVGACIYAHSIGYPFWLGIFSLTVVGLLILLLLPDRHPEPEDITR